MKLQASRKLEIEELAEQEVDINSSGTGATDLENILKENGIKLHKGEFPEKFDAVLLPENGRFHIHLNLKKIGEDQNSPRVRFTIAHELGHYFIDEHRTKLLTSTPNPSLCGLFDNNENNEEHEADYFAANLTMPPTRFKKEAAKIKSPLETILALSKKFKTSLTATAIQFVNHVSNRSLAIHWKPTGEMNWSIPGTGYRIAGYKSVQFKTLGNLPKDCATAKVISGKASHETGVLDMASVFHNVYRDGERNTLLTEEAIALGEYGVITIISDYTA